MAYEDADLVREREERARVLAFEEGRHREQVDGRLNSHEARLKAINGNIARQADETSKLKLGVGGVGDKLDALIVAQQTRDAVAAATEDVLKDHARKTQTAAESAKNSQISNRMFLVGVAAVIATLLGVAVTLLAFLGHA